MSKEGQELNPVYQLQVWTCVADELGKVPVEKEVDLEFPSFVAAVKALAEYARKHGAEIHGSDRYEWGAGQVGKTLDSGIGLTNPGINNPRCFSNGDLVLYRVELTARFRDPFPNYDDVLKDIK